MGKGPYRPLCCCEPRRAYLYSPVPESHSVPWVRFALSSTRPSLSVLLQPRLPQDLCRLSWGSRVPRQLLSAPCQSANSQSLWLPMWGSGLKISNLLFLGPTVPMASPMPAHPKFPRQPWAAPELLQTLRPWHHLPSTLSALATCWLCARWWSCGTLCLGAGKWPPPLKLLPPASYSRTHVSHEKRFLVCTRRPG